MSRNMLKNNFTKMFNINKSNIDSEIARLSTVEHASPEYRRNGIFNYGASQMFALAPEEVYFVGVGGPIIVGS